ncbi:zinc finger BED domain-containing protein RICESLEEPER 2-like [Humulus lupulus]|uniref:zinc finger BED domain-containing protein RICESLEEPER 2-like n=1 Tax=Humulus lupulus TaxID=3486 RepID=UPI002B41368D|nr:zinc finger BED domain-containing protein RICESLEEPER 2-like [Humulus lupulus]
MKISDGEKQAKERKKENVRKKRNDRQNQDKEKDKETEKEDNEKEKGKEVEQPEKKQRVGKKTSSVWDHYTMLHDCDPKKPRAACNYCGTDYAADTKLNGTSTLWAHVERKCKKCPFSDWVEQSKKQQSTMDRFTKKIQQPAMKKKSLQFPSRFTVARDIYNAFLDQKKELKSILVKHRVSLTTDCWTSIQNISYLCLTAHWVDGNWKMHKRIINFIQVPNYKGDLVGKELINCLNEWGISSVFAMKVDNASLNDVALRKLKGHLLDKDITIPLNGEMFHMRCSAHILNLIVTDGLKELNDAISSIQNAVRYVQSSPARLKRFKESCKDANIESKALLCLDVVTRWNSTYLMLESATKFKKAFENLEADVNYTKYFDEERMDGPPTNLDWEKEVVQADLTTMASNPDTLLGAMAVSMRRKYDKYWGRIEKLNMLTFIANILDPRYKLEVVTRGFKFVYTLSEVEKMIKLVTNTLAQLYAFYKQQQPSQSSQAQPSQSQS